MVFAPVRYYMPADQKIEAIGEGLIFQHYDNQHRLKREVMAIASVTSKPILAPHCELAAELAKRLRAEQETGDWLTSIPEMMALTAAWKDANPRVQAMFLQRLLALDEAAGGDSQLPPQVKQSISDISATQINFLAPDNDLTIRPELDELGKRMLALSLRLSTHVSGQLLQRARASVRAEMAGLYRPLAVSGVVGVAPDGQAQVSPLGSGNRTEYWTIVIVADRPVFKIVALGSADATRWTTDPKTLAVGQVLLSPADGADTEKLLHRVMPGEVAGELPSGWPLNVLTMQQE